MATPNFQSLLARSYRLHDALDDAIGDLAVAEGDLRASVTLEALEVAMQHGAAVRCLLAEGLGVSAIGVARMQYEAVLRAAWASFAAEDAQLAILAAPLTPGSLERANKKPVMAAEQLAALEASPAPAELKRALREVRTSAWDVMNSNAHAGLHALRRHDGSLEQELTVTLRISNGFAYLAAMLMVGIGHAPQRQADINVLFTAFPECMNGMRK